MKTILLTVVSLCVLSACGHPTATPHETSSQSNSSHVNRQQSSKPSQAVKVSVSAVVELMHDRWGTDVDLSSIEIEPHGNQYQYDVEAVDDDTEYQMVLDGRTGRVLRQAQHALAADEAGGVERQEHAINTEHLLALGHITQAATQRCRVPRASGRWNKTTGCRFGASKSRRHTPGNVRSPSRPTLVRCWQRQTMISGGRADCGARWDAVVGANKVGPEINQFLVLLCYGWSVWHH
ncbi:PepSY domain-containing protein [Lacticaseibacillus thailandensis]|uniref:PepSY domain-containing protein n=1 Tax=Lacticaseibacillus thailandensis TaxID=381741 RepID=UPI0006D1FDE7|nr:PepSY domain-containing protein [Lacticaseibacillus thailandensis]